MTGELLQKGATFAKRLPRRGEQARALWLPGAALGYSCASAMQSGEISFRYPSVEGNYIRLLFPNLGGSRYSE